MAYHIKAIHPSFYCSIIAFFKKWCLVELPGNIFADVSTSWTWVENKTTPDHHVTSHDRIFTIFAGNVSFVDILFVSKYEVICNSWTKVMSILKMNVPEFRNKIFKNKFYTMQNSQFVILKLVTNFMNIFVYIKSIK